jgi:hypothetical protein
MQSTTDKFTPVGGTGSTSSCALSSELSLGWNSAVLAAVLLGVTLVQPPPVGTGGFATAQALNYLPGNPSVARIAHEPDGSIVAQQHVLDTQEKLAGIRHYLSANVTEMAKVFRVGRPTVYSWLRDDPGLRANHARRIDEIYEIARMWRSTSNKPIGEFMSRPLDSGATLLELLSANSLDESAIQSAFIQIAQAASRKAQRLSAADVAKKRGFRLAPTQPITNWASKDEVDL